MRTLNDLTAGTIVYLNETRGDPSQLNHVPYIYLGLDDSDHALLLRKYCDPDRTLPLRSGGSGGANYSYNGSPPDTYLTETLYGMFDEATQNAMVNTDIKCMDVSYVSGSHTITVLQRKIFLLSESEYGFDAQAAGSEGPSYLSALKTAYQTESASTARKTKMGPYSTSNQAYWTRSPYQSTSSYYFAKYGFIVSSTGDRNNTAYNNYYYVRPAIAFSKTTQVSDAGVDNIFLLPTGRDTTFRLEVKFLGNAHANRPKTIKAFLGDMSEFKSYTLKACNNYADSSPTWVTCDSEGIASLGTTKTGEYWRIGLWFDGVGKNEESHLDQPQMILELDNN